MHLGKNGNDDILDINQLLDGVEQMKQLIDLGYDISFNIGRIDKISKNQLYEVCKILAPLNIKYFTMADTYGSVDLDLISLLPYAPKYASYLYSELKKTYCIDVHQIFLKEQFLNSKMFDDQTWICSKNRAVESGTYDYVIEYTHRNRSSLPIVFENERYRIYKISEQ